MAARNPIGTAFLLLFTALFALFSSGCGGGSELAPAKSPSGSATATQDAQTEATPAPAEPSFQAPSGDLDEKPTAEVAPARGRGEVSDGSRGGSSPAQAALSASSTATAAREPLLIYTATLTLAVFEARAAISAVEELARTSGGYLVNRGDDSVTIRVPSRAFRGALGSVSRLGDELHRDVDVRDVTEQFADIETRLRNAQAVRLRLEALLEKAAKIEDALAVERELERVTQTIEQLKGRLRLLSELIAYSTITVNFRARPRDHVGSETRLPFPWLNELGLVPLMNLEAP
jgi:hypothetical protein